ncbi:MAG TPA: hypothetical protein VFX61_15090 [Micromonosporaceae bacterium]|nr:hypothetical protein [Micromonosporaceae bacterium]
MRSTKKAWGRGLVALAVVLGTVAAAVPSSGAPTKAGDRLSGKVGGNLPESFGPWAGDPVRFQIDAQGVPGATTGTFKAFHGKGTTAEVVGDFEGDITCLITAGEVAVATGVVTRGYVNLPGQETKDVTGQKVSFTVHDNERSDRSFWMWEFLGAPINDCQGTAPIFEPSYGNLQVRD